MDRELLIAAGGGGDAIAAAIIHRALRRRDARPAIATYSWDRLLIDPVPGPRDPSAFTGLEPVGANNYRVTADTAVIPPAGSTLPRLAAELDADLYLVDPRHGALGLAHQLDELAALTHSSTITIVDVGGDILAHGDEPTLKSPLADSIVLAAATDLDHDVQLLVTGPGIDGELSEPDVLSRYEQLNSRCIHVLSLPEVAPFWPLFEWHPSEATGLLCAAAAGARGTAEIRDRGFPVALTDRTPEVRSVSPRRALSINTLAQAMIGTRSLAAAEDALRSHGRDSEIEYERRKARDQQSASRATAADAFTVRLSNIRSEAMARGVDFITLRGLAERLHLRGPDLAELQRQLRLHEPGKFTPPLWALRPEPPSGPDISEFDGSTPLRLRERPPRLGR